MWKSYIQSGTLLVFCYSSYWPKFLKHFVVPLVALAESWNEQLKQYQIQSNNESNTQTDEIFFTINFMWNALKSQILPQRQNVPSFKSSTEYGFY